MLRYIDEDSPECRSRMLLRYFGEEAERDCGICDVCRRRGVRAMPTDQVELLAQHILAQLAAGPLGAYELNLSGFDPYLLEEAIDRLRAAGQVSFEGQLLTSTLS